MKKSKKFFKRIISIVLAFVFLLSTSVFAESKIPYYVAIGDSITAGYGLKGGNPKQRISDIQFSDNIFRSNVDASYPTLIAKRICEHYGQEYTSGCYANLGAVGFQVTDYAYLLGEKDASRLADYIGYYWANYVNSFLDFAAPGSDVNWDDYKWAAPIVKEAKKADIITFFAGANDFIRPLLDGIREKDNAIINAIGYLINALYCEIGLTNIDVQTMLSNLEGSYNLSEAIEFFDMDNISELMLSGINSMEDSYKQVAKELRALNPNAEIILVGLYNPYWDTQYLYGKDCLVDELYEAVKDNACIGEALFKEIAYSIIHDTIGYAVSKAINRLNEIVKETAEENNLEYVILSGSVSNEVRLGVHPTAAQHSDIADTIYKKIENYLQ